MAKDKEEEKKSPQFNVKMDPEKTQILYTDTIFINVNADGVMLDICQKVGNSNQLQVVTRIGMSREHANKFAKKLNEILALTMGHAHSSDKN